MPYPLMAQQLDTGAGQLRNMVPIDSLVRVHAEGALVGFRPCRRCQGVLSAHCGIDDWIIGNERSVTRSFHAEESEQNHQHQH